MINPHLNLYFGVTLFIASDFSDRRCCETTPREFSPALRRPEALPLSAVTHHPCQLSWKSVKRKQERLVSVNRKRCLNTSMSFKDRRFCCNFGSFSIDIKSHVFSTYPINIFISPMRCITKTLHPPAPAAAPRSNFRIHCGPACQKVCPTPVLSLSLL